MAHPVKVYSTDYCPYCTQAKTLLTGEGIAFEEIDVTNQPELRAKLSADNNGFRTVPMIFIGDEFIGGFTDLAKLKSEGTLKPKVEA
jgi:glutaredoxin 3